MHLFLDGRDLEAPSIADIMEFLTSAPGVVGMTAIQPPIVLKTPSGYAGYILLAESHVSYHRHHEEVHIDCFSCKEFDDEVFEQFCERALNVTFVRRFVDVKRLDLENIGVRC